MRIFVLITPGLITFWAAALFAQLPVTNPNMPAGNAQTGRRIFESYGCYQCHGREAQGGLGTGPRLGPRPIGFAAFQSYLRRPTGQMPPYTSAVVSDRDVADMYSFLQSVKEPAAVKDLPLLRDF